MIGYIVLALFNGIMIGLCRGINGRLSQVKGPFRASFYNHLIGALVLTLIIIGAVMFSVWDLQSLLSATKQAGELAPWPVYLGGVIGALYVTLNSHILTRIGALKAALFVISGQMITGVIFDISEQSLTASLAQLTGVALIIIGVYTQTTSKCRIQHVDK